MLKQARTLALYLEPTPYIMRLLEHLDERFAGETEVFFAGENLSQNWSLSMEHPGWHILPNSVWKQFVCLAGKVRTGNFTLVHLAGWSGHPMLPVLLILARLYRLPVTMESDTPLPVSLSGWKYWLKKLVYPLWFSQVAMFLPGGKRQVRYLQHYGVPDSRITVAGMTVDVSTMMVIADQCSVQQRKVLKGNLGLDPGSCVFLFVGRLEPHKGIAQLLSAFGALDCAGNKASLVLVGDGSLQDVCKNASAIFDTVVCTGRLSGADLYNAYLAADVLVLPSQFEPWGLVVNEAMAMALPVIASDRVGCVDDLLEPGVTGAVVTAGDEQSLARAMQELLDDSEKRKTMAGNARSLISKWTLEAEADTIARCWSTLMTARP